MRTKLLLSGMMMLCLFGSQSLFAFSGGNGTSGYTYQVATPAYSVQAIKYNGSAGTEKYTTSTATDNPKSQMTVGVPTVTGVSPSTGPVGTLVTITGTNLGNPTAFTIGGVTAIAVSDDGTSLVGMVMPGATTGTVTVTTAAGTATDAGNFTVTATPYPNVQQGGKLTGADNTGAANQGYSVAISANGNTAIVGGYHDNSNQGAAWVYTRSGSTWTQQGSKLVGTGNTGAACQGWSVSLSADGNTALVGGYEDNSNQGAAWVWTRSGSTWTQQGNKLVGAGNMGAAYQGSSVSLSADGNTAIVGGNGDNSHQGAAWVYTRSGGTWTQQGSKLVGTGNPDAANQGCSVSLSADGNTAIVGGYTDNNYEGAAWVYTRSGGTWSQQGSKLVGSGGWNIAVSQGASVCLSADGNTAMVGGYEDYNYRGAVWVFTRSGSTWTQQGNKLVGTGYAGSSSDQGFSVSLSADGNTAMVGGNYDNSGQGAVWVWTRSGSTWTQQGSKLVGSGGSSDGRQSTSVSLSADGTTAIMGGYFDNSEQGAAWVFIPLVAPTIQASAITYSSVQTTQMTIGWTNGNGVKRTVFVKEGTGALTNPADNTTYAAGTDWTAKGTQLGSSGYYCVYNNTGNSVTLTGLTAGTTYTVEVFEYNGLGGAEKYTTSTATDNPKSQMTVGVPTVTGISPSTGPVGTLVTITGTNLGNLTAFTIGGVTAIAVSDDGTSLVGMVMPGATTGTVAVTTAGGTATGAFNFTVCATPYPNAQQGTKLVGSGGSGIAYQGTSVSVSADGNTAIVGGPQDSNYQGAAWVYTRTGGTWTQQGSKLTGTGNTGTAGQGFSVALSADGNTAIVGGYQDNGYLGAAWVWTRSGSTWTQQGGKLVGTGNTGAAYQGYSVSLSADGNTAIVGGFEDNSLQGAAWVFTRSGGIWTQQGSKLVGTGNTGYAQQGNSVSLSADGNTAMVGGYQDNRDQGAAWVYTRSGSAWTQQGSKLVGTGNAGTAYQGSSVSLSADGNTAIIGGFEDNGYQGAAWVYTRSGSTWTQQGNKLVGTGNAGYTLQGNSVSLSADGNTAMVAGYHDNSEQGATWIYTRSGSTWTQQGNKLVGTGNIGYAQQGVSVSLSADGTTAIMGGFFDNNQQGAAWVFIPVVAPTTQASAITCSSVQTTQMTIGWTNGNGASRAVFLKEGTGTITNPADNATYTAGTDWTAKGTQLGSSGYYCVYNNTGNSVTLTGLTAGTTYTVELFEYNGLAGTEKYTTSIATDNPKSQMTVGIPAVTGISPSTGPVGTLVTITGTNLNNPTAFTIGGVTAIAVSDDGTSLVGMVMPGATTGTMVVTTAGGTATGLGNFTVTATPFPAAQQGSKLTGPDNTGAALQGRAVSVSADGNTAIVGGPEDNSGQGAAWIYTRSGSTWTQQGSKLVGTGNTGAAGQGFSVSLSADGNTAIVGGYQDNGYLGAAWVWSRSGSTWTQQGSKLVGIGNTGAAYQGRAVSLSADGNTAIVGGDQDNNLQGAAWVWTRLEGVWTQQGSKLVGTGNTGAAGQGYSVSLSADGNTAIVGGDADNGDQGAVWVYTRSGGTWTQQGSKLVGSGNAGNASQGYSVSLSADGNTAMVGGFTNNSNQGAAWVWTRSGGVWTQQGSKLVGTGNTGAAYQGSSVSLSADGNTAMVGGFSDKSGQGAAWVWTRSGVIWTQQGSKLVGSGNAGNAYQGLSVSLSKDGKTAMVGGYADNSGQGAAWVFIPVVTPTTQTSDISVDALLLYPNPATDGFTINACEKMTTVSIYTLSGILVQAQLAIGKTFININGLKQGIYIVKANGYVEKLVKK